MLSQTKKYDYLLITTPHEFVNIINKKCGDTSWIDMKSVTKLFVAVAIANLVHEKKLKYTDPIKKYFPSYEYSDITILNILQHKSGLENEWSYLGKDGK